MGYTLAHGVARTRDAAGWVVALADMPRIRPATIIAIRDALAAGAAIAAPVYRGERGHPVGFSSALGGELVALSGDSGAKAVLQRHGNAIVLIDCDDPGVVLDIDQKSDLGRIV
jgi:molybdenum cofactor cytidylyltransferase